MAADGGRILLRKATPTREEAPEPPISPARLLRRAVARAGTQLGAQLSAIGVEEGEVTLDEVLSGLDQSHLMIVLERSGEALGLAVADLELRDVLVEVQTLGQVAEAAPGRSSSPAVSRPVTRADAALARPLIEGVLEELRQGGPGTDLPLWADGVVCGSRLGTTRDVGAQLRPGDYRRVCLSLDPGADGRQGLLTLILPPAGSPTQEDCDSGDDRRWSAALEDAVFEAPATLTAVLTRQRLTLQETEGFSVGQLLPLPGVAVSSVVVEGADRAVLGTARLGQVAGRRAVRLELPGTPDLGSALCRRDRGPDDALLVSAGGPPDPATDEPPPDFATAMDWAEAEETGASGADGEAPDPALPSGTCGLAPEPTPASTDVTPEVPMADMPTAEGDPMPDGVTDPDAGFEPVTSTEEEGLHDEGPLM